jgi:Cdc6-like AAA superfamily ATPase
MSDYSKLNLKDNPFAEITPSLNQENLIWAGMPLLRKKIENIHQTALTGDQRQIILNWGTAGAGKTYSAFYFSNEKRIKSIAPEYKDDIFFIYMQVPKEGNNAVRQLFKDILDSFSLSRIKSQIQFMIQDRGRESLLRSLSQKIRSEEFSKAILLLGNQDSEQPEIMSRYLFGNAKNTELKKIGLARPLKSASDFAKILAGIFMLFTETHKGRLFIWLDETEDLLFFTQKQYRVFSQFLRELFDHLDKGMTVFMNSTFADPDKEMIELLFGRALWSRITDHIRFNELSVPEGMQYCKDLIKPYQIQKDLGEYSPFTEELLSCLLNRIPKPYMIPLEINKNCSGVLNLAVESDTSVISESLISEWFSKRNITI